MMMFIRNRSLHIVGVFVFALGTVLSLSACGPEANVSEEDFLSDMRVEADKVPIVGNSEGAMPPPGTAIPQIELETDAFEMGTIANDHTAEATTMIHNRGEADLIIKRITTSCGCTTGRMVENLIPPGESRAMVINVHPNKIPRFYAMKTLTLATNDPTHSVISMTVRTYVEPEVAWSPLWPDLGIVPEGEEAEMTFRVRQMTDVPLDIKEVSTYDKNVSASLEPVDESEWAQPGRHEYDVTLVIAADAKKGAQDGKVLLKTNLLRTHKLYIDYRVAVQDDYWLQPRVLVETVAQPGDQAKAVSTLRANEPIIIEQVTSLTDTFTASARPGKEPNSWTFDLTSSADAKQYKNDGDVRVNFRIGDKTYSEIVRVVLAVDSLKNAGDVSVDKPRS